MCEWKQLVNGSWVTECCIALTDTPERLEEYECCPFCGAEIEVEEC